MARSSIVDKLNIFLSNNLPFSEECQVVYLMVELRKILDHDSDGSKYSLIKFYCDWTLHIVKNRHLEVIKEIVAKIDADVSSEIKFIKNPQQVFYFLKMTELKNQMTRMFSANHLPQLLFKDDLNWISFVDNLNKNLSEQPILFKSGPIGSLEIVYVENGHSILNINFNDSRGSWSIGGMFE